MSAHTPALHLPSFSHGGVNLAPLKPLQELRDGNEAHESSLQKAIKELYDSKMKYESSTWDELISAGQQNSFFRQGKQLLMKKPYGAGYYVRQVQGADTYQQKAMNLMNFYAQCCVSKMMASNPNVRVRAASEDPRAIASSSDARILVDHYENEFYTAKFKIRQALYSLDNGLFIRRIYYDPHKKGPTGQRKDVSESDLQLGQGYGECYDCGFNHTDISAFNNPELPYGKQCPECGSYAVDAQAAPQTNLQTVSNGEQVQYGDLDIKLLPFPACRWDLARDAEDSSWFIYRQRIPVGLIKLFLGDLVIPDSNSSDDKGLDALHALAYAGQAFDGSSSQDPRKRETDRKPTLAEFWLSPEDYAHIILDGGMTVSGQEIPKGRMSDFFSRPVCSVGLNDMSLVIGLFEEGHPEQIVTGHWFMESDSGAGRGLGDTAAVQKRFNAGDGLLYQGMHGTATPTVVHDPKLLTQEKAGYLFKPNTNIEVNLAMLPPNTKLQDAYFMARPGEVSNQYLQYNQVFLRDMFQLSSMVTEFSDALQGVNPNTATGSTIAANLANSLFSPMTAVQAGACKRTAEIIVEQYRKHIPVGRFFQGKGTKQGRYLSGADLKGDLVFEIEEDSDLPTTPFTKRGDLVAMIQGVGGPQGLVLLKQEQPDMYKHYLSTFNVKLETEDSDAVSTLCQDRLDQMKRNLSAGATDPAILIQSLRPPVSPKEPKHTEKRQWWSEYLDREEGQDAPQELRLAAEMMYDLHQQYETGAQSKDAFNAGVVQTANAAPQTIAQAAAPQVMSSMGIQQPDEQAAQQQTQAAQQQHEASQADQDRVHQAGEAEADRQTQLQMNRDKLSSQERIARAQAQNRSKAA